MCTPADRARHTAALTEMGRLLDTVGAALLEHHTRFAAHAAGLVAGGGPGDADARCGGLAPDGRQGMLAASRDCSVSR